MSERFLITGLPRSRTAWLSVAATTQRSICLHEPTAHVSSYSALRDLWRPSFGHYLGFSDSSLSLWLGRILADVKPRTLIVYRKPGEVLTSFLNYMQTSGVEINAKDVGDYLGGLQEEIFKYRNHPLVRVLSFEDLNDYDKVLGSLTWLIPGNEFPDLRALMAMNIQVDRKWAIKQAMRGHTGWQLRKQDAVLDFHDASIKVPA